MLALHDAGLQVVVLDDLSTGHIEAVPAGIPFVRGSTGDSGLVRRTLRRHGVGAVVHLAGSQVVSENVARPLSYWRNNVANTLSLAEACVAEGVTRMVFSSTAAVYGIADGAPVTEDTPCHPINPYGASKLAAERLLQDLATAHGVAVVALRYFNVAAPMPRTEPGSATAMPRTSSRSPARRLWAGATNWQYLAEITTRPTGPACATTSMSPTSPARTSPHCATSPMVAAARR